MARTRLEYSPRGLPLIQLPGSALVACLKEGLTRSQLGKDIVAGALVGVIALPLAMALSIAVGLSPQHGIYTSIIAGIITPLLGGSRLNVVGPTAAFVVILAPIVAVYGLAGLLVAGMMSGIILMGMGFLRMGKLIEFIPFPVTTGFTSGIAIVIAGLQLKDALGIRAEIKSPHFLEKMYEVWLARGSFSWGEIAITALTLAILLLNRLPEKRRHWIPKAIMNIPAPLLALPIAALFTIVLESLFPGLNIVTLGKRFVSISNGLEIHGIPRALPTVHWPWDFSEGSISHFELSLDTIRALLPSAFTIAFLGAIESLLSAVVADGMARTRHEPDSELLALGLANFVTPFFGGIPATGAIARTASNYRFGGRTPIAAAAHAITVLFAVIATAPLLSYLPMASMAALLLIVAWNMSEIDHFIHTIKVAPKSDIAVLLICFSLTIAFDMVIAVSVGVLLGALFFIRRMASLTEGYFVEPAQSRSRRNNLPKDVVLYSINGPLFFGAAERAIGALRSIGKDVKAIIFDLNDVMAIDMTGLVAMEGVLAELKVHGIKTVMVGVQNEVKNLFYKGGLQPVEGVLAYAKNIEEAIEIVGAKLEKYQRRPETGQVRLQPLHRQKTGVLKNKNEQG